MLSRTHLSDRRIRQKIVPIFPRTRRIRGTVGRDKEHIRIRLDDELGRNGLPIRTACLLDRILQTRPRQKLVEHRAGSPIACHLRDQVHHRLLVRTRSQRIIHLFQLAVHLADHILAALLLPDRRRNDPHIILHLLDRARPVDHHDRDAQIAIHRELLAFRVCRSHHQIRPRLRHKLHRQPRERNGHRDILRILCDIGNRRITIRLRRSHQMIRSHDPQKHRIDRCRISQDPFRLSGDLHFLPRRIDHGVALSLTAHRHLLHPAAGHRKGKQNRQSQAHHFIHSHASSYDRNLCCF